MANINYNQKPKRPFGLTLAIVASVMLFTVLPILEVLFILSVDQMMVFDEVGRSGLDIVGLDGFRQQMIVQIIFAIGFLVIAILSWRGRPTVMRYILSGTLTIIGVLTIFSQILPRMTARATTLDASRDVSQPVLTIYLIITILITLYSVWYVNRWASRAYFRGHFLPEDIEEIKRIEQEMMPSAENVTT